MKSFSPLNYDKAKGYTLIELMVVLAIIGILSATARPSYQTYTEKSSYTEAIMASGPYKPAVEVCSLTIPSAKCDFGVNSISSSSFSQTVAS
jgi:type IV pilus assembly protein PilA